MKNIIVITGWLFVSGWLSFELSFFKWGDPHGFHGWGWPVYTVIWAKRNGTGELIDFPNVFGIPENFLIVCAFGFGLAWVVRTCVRFVRQYLK